MKTTYTVSIMTDKGETITIRDASEELKEEIKEKCDKCWTMENGNILSLNNNYND